MIPSAPEHPRRRLADRGRIQAAWAWWREYGNLVLGIFGICTCVVLVFFAVQIKAQQNAGRIALYRQCVQLNASKKEQRDFHHRGVITAGELAIYMRNLPSKQACASSLP